MNTAGRVARSSSSGRRLSDRSVVSNVHLIFVLLSLHFHGVFHALRIHIHIHCLQITRQYYCKIVMGVLEFSVACVHCRFFHRFIMWKFESPLLKFPQYRISPTLLLDDFGFRCKMNHFTNISSLEQTLQCNSIDIETVALALLRFCLKASRSCVPST